MPRTILRTARLAVMAILAMRYSPLDLASNLPDEIQAKNMHTGFILRAVRVLAAVKRRFHFWPLFMQPLYRELIQIRW